MIIREYSDNNLDDVIRLFVDEYKVDFTAYRHSFTSFFDHPFQKDKCIRIVAVNDQDQIMGFQSFFYWPYKRSGKRYNVYQSGSSIVSRKARGQGVFQKMLGYMETARDKYGIDFFIGFPVEASYKSFISNGWNNPFDLQWYMKVKNPLGFLFSWLYAGKNRASLSGPFDSSVFRLENTQEFRAWRDNYQKDKYRVFTYGKGQHVFEVSHKVNTRKMIFNELIIGEVLFNTSDKSFIEEAFRKYRSWLFFQLDISILSFCTNNENDEIAAKMLNFGLKRIDRKIYFITKYAGQMNREEWLLYRSDVDTW